MLDWTGFDVGAVSATTWVGIRCDEGFCGEGPRCDVEGRIVEGGGCGVRACRSMNAMFALKMRVEIVYENARWNCVRKYAVQMWRRQ